MGIALSKHLCLAANVGKGQESGNCSTIGGLPGLLERSNPSVLASQREVLHPQILLP